MASGPSVTWLAQPDVEKSRTEKLCAKCEQPATLVCSRCHCTIYCQRECQRKHWRAGHKSQCTPDPLFILAKPLSLSQYRDFTATEKEEHLAFTLQPGRCTGSKTDDRDGYCRIITVTEQQFVEFIAIGNYRDDQPQEMLALMGWGYMGTEAVSGFSAEDAIIYRIFFDDSFLNRSDLEENLIAHSLMTSHLTRGKFVVIKTMADSDNPIPFTKAELVGMMIWRVVCGSHQLVSSRMFRENMRRREMQEYLTNMGVQTYNLGEN